MRDGHLEASGHNWVEGQGSGPRIDKGKEEEEDQYDAMGNKIDKEHDFFRQIPCQKDALQGSSYLVDNTV